MAGEEAANAKRKREDGSERKSKAARHSSARQERLEAEFGELYFGPTSLYKLLELRQLQQPALLPRSLSYRLLAARKSAAAGSSIEGDKANNKTKKKNEKKKREEAAVVGATMREIKLAITADLTQSLAKENGQLGLRLAIYTAKGRSFEDNLFTPIAECMIPVPCSKNVRIPKAMLQAHSDIVVATFQVVTIGELATRLTSETEFEFATAKSTAAVVGKELLSTEFDGKAPLYGNMLRIYPAQHRRGSYEVELPVISSALGGGVKCLFDLSWDALPVESKMKRLDRIAKAKFVTDKSNEPVSGTAFQLAVPNYAGSKPNVDECQGVWFHYLYHSMLRRLSEKRLEYSCALCNMHAGSLRGLMTHLVCSHDRFRFQATVGHDSVPHIFVMIMNPRPRAFLGETETRSALCELELNRNDDLDRSEHHFTYMSAKKGGSPGPQTETVERLMGDLDELEEIAEEKDPEFYAPLLQRQYFHSRTGAVVLDHEKDYDSDDDVDEEWIIQQSEKLLDEFEDVALEEKEFMKKWNRHVKEHRILADFMVATSCRHFAKLHGKWLIAHGLRHNFLLHLLNLWDNSLLNSRAIIDCMLIVDHIADNDALNQPGPR